MFGISILLLQQLDKINNSRSFFDLIASYAQNVQKRTSNADDFNDFDKTVGSHLRSKSQ
jgi:hypothetical protein